jgi:hypothetical protein
VRALRLVPPPVDSATRVDDDSDDFAKILETTEWESRCEAAADAFEACCGPALLGHPARALAIVTALAEDVLTLRHLVGRPALEARRRIDRTFAALHAGTVEKQKELAVIRAVSLDAVRWSRPLSRYCGPLAFLDHFVGSLWPEIVDRVSEVTFVAASKAWRVPNTSRRKSDGQPSFRAGPRRWPRILDLLEEAGLSSDTARISDPVRRAKARERKIEALKALWRRLGTASRKAASEG